MQIDVNRLGHAKATLLLSGFLLIGRLRSRTLPVLSICPMCFCNDVLSV
jgi:hypothetical protein